jgi:sialic acid synthase SpsE
MSIFIVAEIGINHNGDISTGMTTYDDIQKAVVVLCVRF